jgi:hypothetical protein
MPAALVNEASFVYPLIKFGFIGEAVAGNHTLTGIRPEDKLIQVVVVLLALTEGTPNTLAFTFADLTSEFTISADNTLNNTGGTTLVDKFALVAYMDMPEELVP